MWKWSMLEKRKTTRLDYKKLHTTGERVEKLTQPLGANEEKASDESDYLSTDEQTPAASGKSGFVMSDEEKVKSGYIQAELEVISINEDIDDYFDENPVDEIGENIEDIDANVRKIEELRSTFRKKIKEYQSFLCPDNTDPHAAKFEEQLETIKIGLKDLKFKRQRIRSGEAELKKDIEELADQKVTFIKEEIKNGIIRLSNIFNVTHAQWEKISDEEIVKRKGEVSTRIEDIDKLAKLIKELMETANDRAVKKYLEEAQKRYTDLNKLKDTYVQLLEGEVKKREIEERKAFNKSKMNIKLPKFAGYTGIDIYSFKSDFEKIHVKTTPATPKNLLPDVLKNNFLEKTPLMLVKDLANIDDIWKRLLESYGDCKMLLNKKISQIENMEGLWKHKDAQKTVEGLSKIIHIMRDLANLADEHQIEDKLYYGDSIEKIQGLMGEGRFTRWLTSKYDKNVNDGKDSWKDLISFLEKDLKINQEKLLWSNKAKKSSQAKQDLSNEKKTKSHHTPHNEGNLKCSICDATDHVATNGPWGMKLIQYFVCPKFSRMTPAERLNELKNKGLCFQCLFPGALMNKGKHQEGKCQRDYICKHPSHNRHINKKHVLVCEEHKQEEENKQILEEFKRRCISRRGQVELPEFSKTISIHHNFGRSSDESSSTEEENDSEKKKKKSVSWETQLISNPEDLEEAKSCEDVDKIQAQDIHAQRDVFEDSIYILQKIKVEGKKYTIFFDSGCKRFVSRFDAIQRLGSRATLLTPGPITIEGVGNMSMETPHGIYGLRIPLRNGEEALLSGTCMDLITETFPTYPLQGEVEDDIKKAYCQVGGDPKDLPKLEPNVGGSTDMMMGMTYNKYFPSEVFTMASGLKIYRSVFKNASGGCGVIGGPHHVFSKIERQYNKGRQTSEFIARQLQIFRCGYQLNPDIRLLGYKTELQDDDSEDEESHQLQIHINSIQQRLKKMKEIMEAGSEINYRCPRCRSCHDCKNCDEGLSFKEEVEQELIEDSVTVDVKNRQVLAVIPFLADPIVKLAPNREIALKIYKQQVKKINKNPSDKEAILKSEAKLQELSFVDYLDNLPLEIQEFLKNSPIQNFLPWIIVWKSTSLTTPTRMAFHGSMPTSSGYSLNDIVPKGANSMNKLLEIFLRWRSYPVAYHNDVNKMYNCLKLKPDSWVYQRYLFEPTLDPEKEPREKIIKTAIYGVKSSGNQAEAALRRTAEIFKDEYPDVYEVVRKEIYVDDLMSGASSKKQAFKRTDQIELVLNHGGFTLKGFTMTGQNPEKSLSEDGSSILVGGHRWFSKDDLISLNVNEINFAKKSRGRTTELIKEMPKKLTRRICTSKVASIFDLSGLLTPITGTWMLDLHELVIKKLDWDDQVPDNLRPVWEENFKLMDQVNNLQFRRAVIPDDAANLNVTTLEFGDASEKLICVAIYARFLRKNGTYSCQLLFSRSRLVPEEMSLPRAEMYAAVVNTHAGETVRKALAKYHQRSIKFSDSQIVLHWIANETRVLKQWVRNRAIEIRRFTDVGCWQYVRSKDNIADLGTRRCSSLEDVNGESNWINGFKWMKEDESQFPTVPISEINLSSCEIEEISKEKILHSTIESNKFKEEITKRYQFSDYVIDPCRRKFSVVVRILAIVIRFIKSLKSEGNSFPIINSFLINVPSIGGHIVIPEEDVKQAERYFFLKATQEVKKFISPTQYVNLSTEVNGILHYTGRILPEDEVKVVGRMTNVMKDLCSTTFCVPIADKFSPISHSIVDEIHWYDKTVEHCGIETTHRYVMKTIYVIEGRALVKRIKTSCQRCRYLEKKALAIAMGPISTHNITIAPAFYACQLDLAGPYLAYCTHNKRSTIKIWLVVYCCTTTSATKIFVMENYGTQAFIQTFLRLSCQVGFPKHALVDEGSQLIKGCQSMSLDFYDIKSQLHRNHSVELEVCPVGGHNMHGKVERRIRHIKESISKSCSNERLHVLQWETIVASIANCINNLPLALKDKKGDFECMDLITPNRLLLGRNNDRSPAGPLRVVKDSDKIIESNRRIFEAWFEVWLTCHVPKLMDQPKWFRTDRDLKEGDVVLFLKNEKEISSTYQYGRIHSVEVGRDGKIRKAKVRYRNHHEDTDRYSSRSVRSLVMIHPIDEINVTQEIGQIAIAVDAQRRKEMEQQ